MTQPAHHIEFDADGHRYTVDGIRKVSVTQALGEWRRVYVAGKDIYLSTITGARIDGQTMAYAAEFGTAAHKGFKMLLDGQTLDWRAVNPVLIPTLKQLEAWIARHKPAVLLTEGILYSAAHDYTGTLDLLARILYEGREILALIDLKTGAPSILTGPQTAAYEHLVRVNYPAREPIRRFELFVSRDGQPYQMREFNDKSDMEYFLHRLACHRWQERKLRG